MRARNPSIRHGATPTDTHRSRRFLTCGQEPSLPCPGGGRTIRATDPPWAIAPARHRGGTVAFDMSLVQRGARNRRTPYYEATQKYDPKGFTVYNHMYFPIRFDTYEAEFDSLLNDVT